MTREEEVFRTFPLFEEWAFGHCVFRDRCWGGIKLLHRRFTEFCSVPTPCGCETFRWILADQGFELSEELVYGLILAEDDPCAAQKVLPALQKAERIPWLSPNGPARIEPGLTREPRCPSLAESPGNIYAYYCRVLADWDLRRHTGRDWTAVCPGHGPNSPHKLILNFETGGYQCSDRACELASGANIFHFEMARQRRETGSVPAFIYIVQRIEGLIGEEGSKEVVA